MLIYDDRSEMSGGLQGVQGAGSQTWEGTSVAAWVKGEVSCCSLISGRDCESPAEPVQPEEALLCRADTGSHARLQEPVGMVGGTTKHHTACRGSTNTNICTRQPCCMLQQQAVAGTCGSPAPMRCAAVTQTPWRAEQESLHAYKEARQ